MSSKKQVHFHKQLMAKMREKEHIFLVDSIEEIKILFAKNEDREATYKIEFSFNFKIDKVKGKSKRKLIEEWTEKIKKKYKTVVAARDYYDDEYNLVNDFYTAPFATTYTVEAEKVKETTKEEYEKFIIDLINNN